MARALVVVESMFGNTLAVGDAVAAALSSDPQFDGVEVVRVDVAPTTLPDDVGLLVVGSPTHVRGLSRSITRQEAFRQAGALTGVDTGLREWLTALHAPMRQVAAAAFDTRSNPSWVTGSAAAAALRRLHALGLRTPRQPTSFFVSETTGPLGTGELERATRWGATLAAWYQSVAAA